MRYFKNSEVSRLYNVSEKAVRNWIERAPNVGLELFAKDGKSYIIDSIKNGSILEDLAWKSRKYRNRRSHRVLTPTNEFYNIYSPAQIHEIVNSLDLYKIFPLKFKYIGDDGAKLWDAYLRKLRSLNTDNYITSTIHFLRDNRDTLDKLIGSHAKLNVVDIGVGNGSVVIELIQHLIKQNKLNKYIGIDISSELLDITAGNLHEWVSSSVRMEKYVQDITYDRFHAQLTGPGTTNLVLFLGGTITNFHDPSQPLKTIRDSIGKKDLLVCTLKLDSLRGRKFFDFNLSPQSGVFSEGIRRFIGLLGFDESIYEPEQIFDETLRCRFQRARLKMSVTLHFDINSEQHAVELKKDETIQLADMWHYSDADAESIFRNCGFEILHTSRSESEQFMLIIAKIKVEERDY